MLGDDAICLVELGPDLGNRLHYGVVEFFVDGRVIVLVVIFSLVKLALVIIFLVILFFRLFVHLFICIRIQVWTLFAG